MKRTNSGNPNNTITKTTKVKEEKLMKKAKLRNVDRMILNFFFNLFLFSVHFIVLAFIVAPIVVAILGNENPQQLLIAVWDEIDGHTTGIEFIDAVHRFFRELWMWFGEQQYGLWIQRGILIALSLESIGYFMGILRRGRIAITTGIKSGWRSMTGVTRTASKASSSNDADGYKNWHPGKKGPDDNVPEELKKVVGSDTPVVNIADARNKIKKG